MRTSLITIALSISMNFLYGQTISKGYYLGYENINRNPLWQYVPPNTFFWETLINIFSDEYATIIKIPVMIKGNKKEYLGEPWCFLKYDSVSIEKSDSTWFDYPNRKYSLSGNYSKTTCKPSATAVPIWTYLHSFIVGVNKNNLLIQDDNGTLNYKKLKSRHPKIAGIIEKKTL